MSTATTFHSALKYEKSAIWESRLFIKIKQSSQKEVVLEQTVQCSQTVQFFVVFDMFEVQFLAEM